MIYQFKITLKGIEPPIWRQVMVDPTMTMEELHYVIQSVMGWEAEQLFHFSSGKRRIIDSEDEGDEDDEFASDVLIGQAFRKAQDKWVYLYDLEDEWEHEVVLDKIAELEPGVEYPVCTGGARACPPEDSGGIESYLNLLAILKNPKDPDHKGLVEWLGEDFNPDSFDKDAVNAELHDPENWEDGDDVDFEQEEDEADD